MRERTFQVTTDQQRVFIERFISRQAVPFQCTFGPIREQRSLPQNARLWALHQAASDVTGYAPDEMHNFALCRHFGFEAVELTDPMTHKKTFKRVPLKRSSARDKKEFAEFMTQTEAWYGIEFGVWLGE